MFMKASLFLAASLAFGAAAASGQTLLDPADFYGPHISLHSERWTGLGLASAPSNSGDLDPNAVNPDNRGIIPNSMNGSSRLLKRSGGGYRAGESIYWQSGAGGFTGPEPLFDVLLNIMAGTVTPTQADTYIADGYRLDGEGRFEVNTTFETPQSFDAILFQLDITGFGPTVESFEAGTYISSYELTLMLAPVTLTINGVHTLTGTARNLLYAAYSTGQGQGTQEVEEIWLFEWDLAGFSEPIESYSIAFANYPHASIRALQVDGVAAIPEPSAVALLVVAAGGLPLLARYRNRRRS